MWAIPINRFWFIHFYFRFVLKKRKNHHHNSSSSRSSNNNNNTPEHGQRDELISFKLCRFTMNWRLAFCVCARCECGDPYDGNEIKGDNNSWFQSPLSELLFSIKIALTFKWFAKNGCKRSIQSKTRKWTIDTYLFISLCVTMEDKTQK